MLSRSHVEHQLSQSTFEIEDESAAHMSSRLGEEGLKNKEVCGSGKLLQSRALLYFQLIVNAHIDAILYVLHFAIHHFCIFMLCTWLRERAMAHA